MIGPSCLVRSCTTELDAGIRLDAQPATALPLGPVCGEIVRKFGLGQTAGGNQPFPKSGNRRSIAARLRRINEIPARPQRRFADWRQEPSRAQLIADQRQRAHDHAKPLKCCLDCKVEMLEDLIARRR